LKLCLVFRNGRNVYLSGERKALVTFTLRLSHVSVQRRREGDVSQLVRVSVDMCASMSSV